VGQIRIHVADPNENGPVFHQDSRVWLAKVLEIDIADERPALTAGGEPNTFRISTSAAGIPRGDGGTLVLPPGSAPTISALVAHRNSAAGQRSARPAPLLASRLDPSKPILLIDVPAISGHVLDNGRTALPWLMLDASGVVPSCFPAAAIRNSSGKDLSDSQLLVPLSGASFRRSGSREAITWLVRPDGWEGGQLAQGLQCLALQSCAEGDVLALIGPSANGAMALARKHFVGEVCAYGSRAKAVRQVRTPLVGSVAGGVLLHDPRTADCFALMLSNELIATSSCVIVSAEKRAGLVKALIVDGGTLVGADGRAAPPAQSAGAAAELWNGSWPVLRPSSHLWAARSQVLLEFQGSAGGSKGPVIHMCSSAVTATCLNSSDASVKIPNAPTAADTSTRVEWLVG
jgi:hypothetical protein